MKFKTFVEAALVGTCVDEELVDEIFGSASEFARQVELNGDNFEYGPYSIRYNDEEDVHYFYDTR